MLKSSKVINEASGNRKPLPTNVKKEKKKKEIEDKMALCHLKIHNTTTKTHKELKF